MKFFLHQAVHNHLNFNESLLAAVDFDDNDEVHFPTAPLDDPVWSEEPIPDRDLCIHMALRKSEISYPSQIPMPLQEPIYESITLAEPMNSTDSDIPNFINIPKEVFFQNYLYPPWM